MARPMAPWLADSPTPGAALGRTGGSPAPATWGPRASPVVALNNHASAFLSGTLSIPATTRLPRTRR